MVLTEPQYRIFITIVTLDWQACAFTIYSDNFFEISHVWIIFHLGCLILYASRIVELPAQGNIKLSTFIFNLFSMVFFMQGDLQKIIKKGEELIHDRKHWGQPSEDIGLSALPLEATASAMEGRNFVIFVNQTPIMALSLVF